MQRLIYIVRSSYPSHIPEDNVPREEHNVVESLIEELIIQEHLKHLFFEARFLNGSGTNQGSSLFNDVMLSLDVVVASFQAMIRDKQASMDADMPPTIPPLLYIVPFSAVLTLEQQVKKVSKLVGFNGSSDILLHLYTWLTDKCVYRQVVSMGGEHNLLWVGHCHELHDFYKPNSGFKVVDITLKYNREDRITYELRAYNGHAQDCVDIPKYLSPLIQSHIDRATKASSSQNPAQSKK
ncbi:hypothetical protein HYY69_04230 [Candidatus Woesearchaeota archaeon]|nr:hypothetical protein [Candidatus Woesearchaeota archaeon]